MLLLSLDNSGRDIVAVEKGLAAGIGGQRDERLLRIVDVWRAASYRPSR